MGSTRQGFVKKYFFNSNSIPIIISLTTILIMMVLFRMKRIEQDYRFNELSQSIEKESFRGKELKAKKAKLLSLNNLKELAKKFDLKHPEHDQIIVIP